jgi:hypothetical protein
MPQGDIGVLETAEAAAEDEVAEKGRRRSAIEGESLQSLLLSLSLSLLLPERDCGDVSLRLRRERAEAQLNVFGDAKRLEMIL